MKARVAILVALVLAAAATVGVFAYVNGVRHENQKTITQSATVIVSKVNIQPNTALDPLISAGDFSAASLPTAVVVTGAVTDVGQLRGQTTDSFILAGEQITTYRLQKGAAAGSGGPLGIQSGYEALSLSLDAANAGGGFVRQNDNVTVYASWDDFQIIPGAFSAILAGKSNTKRDLGNVTLSIVPQTRVLRVSGASTNGQVSSEIQVTLELSPDDAAAILQAQETGHVWLALLPPGQKGVATAPEQITKILVNALTKVPA
jgi:Flp pilus assembly protein CpaB